MLLFVVFQWRGRPKLAIFLGRGTFCFLKQTGKVTQVIDANFSGNLADGFAGVSKLFLGVGHPQIDGIFRGGLTYIPFELLLQIEGAIVAFTRL